MKKSSVLIILVVLVVLGGGAFALTRSKKTTTTSQNPPSSPSTTTEPPAPSPTTTTPTGSEGNINTPGVVITYSDNGFSPGTSTVKSGSKVMINNTSSRTLEFNSDPHPVHTDNKELNVGSIPAGGSKIFTLTKTGTWGFHNHLRASDTGKLVVN